MKSKKLKYFVWPSLLLVVSALVFAIYILLPYISTNLIQYNYKYPEKNEKFNVIVTDYLPDFVHTIIKKAFHDREIEINNYSKKPNLIVTNVYSTKRKSLKVSPAPYIVFSAEPKNLRLKQLYKHGMPILEFTSLEPKNYNQIYFPFFAWNGVEIKRQYTNKDRPHFLAYTYLHCLPNRESLFKLIHSKRNDAHALGKCSNNVKGKVPPYSSGWHVLPKIYSEYNFVFAMDNHKLPGYVSEKIVNAFNAGAIPIYWGDSKTTSQIFNKKAYIDVSDFDNLEEAADYIVKLSYNRDKIKAMQNEPIFKNNKAPHMATLGKKNNPLLDDAAQKLRNNFFNTISKNKNNLIKAKWFVL